MTRETGNGNVADPIKLREALDQIKGDVAVIPEGDMAKALYELQNEKHEEAPVLTSGKTEAGESLLDAPYKANIARLALENAGASQSTDEDRLHTIEWEPQEKSPLAKALSESAPATPTEEAVALPETPITAPIENPYQTTHEEAKRKYAEISKAFAEGTASREDVAKAAKEAGDAVKAVEKWNKENKTAPESRMEAIQKKLGAMSSEGLERAKKGGAYTLERYRDAGEFYKKQPFKTKILLSVGLLGLAGGAAFVGGTVGAGVASAAGAATFAQRLFGSAATFVAVEASLKAAEERKNLGKERSDLVKRIHTTEALIAAALVGSGALGYAMQYWNNWEDAKNIAEKISTPASAAVEGTPANIPTEVAPTPTEYIVPQGGTVWGGLTEKLNMQSSFSGLQEGQKSYVIDVLKNKLATMSEGELKAMGISSGNIDKINVGDTINFNALLSNQELIQKATEHASSLSGEQIQNIETNPGIRVTPEAGPTPAEVVPSTIPEVTPSPAEVLPSETMPQGMTPASPEIIAEANKTLKVDLDRILGKTGGFLGLGGTHGIESTHWKNPEFGFANKTVDEVLQASGRPNGLLPNGGKVGIENYDKLTSMQKYLNDVKTFSGLTPAPGEKVEEFIKRGAIKMLEQNASEAPKIPENIPTPIPAEIVPSSTYVETAPASQSIVPEKLEATAVSANELAPINTIEAGSAKGTFTKLMDGKTLTFTLDKTPDLAEGEKLLNGNWRSLIRAQGIGLSDLRMGTVGMNASLVAGYEQILKSLQDSGQGGSPEAALLEKNITRIITETEKQYGDIFK